MSFNEWKEYNLDELYEFSSGLSKSRKEFGFGYPFVTFKDVFYNFFIPSELIELANTTEKERKRCSVKRGDVFLTRTSETIDELGKSSVALKDYESATFNGFTKRLRPKGNVEIYPEYAGYYFRSPRFRSEINSMATMTTRASLNNEMMARLKIVVPNIKEQKVIAQILSDLDEKIEINNKINDNLEKMAQAIFKQWFVDFEFPNENGKPYKSSGGEMIESELGEIPKGWGINKLSEVADMKNGVNYGREQDGEEVKVVNVRDFDGSLLVDDEKLDSVFLSRKQIEDYKLKKYDTIIVRSAKPGETLLVNDIKIKVYSGFTIRIRVRNYDKKLYTFYCVRNSIKQLENSSNGTIFKNLNQQLLGALNIIEPCEKVLEKYNRIIYSIIEKIYSINEESNKLMKLRDTLLPKLMSGEIRVPLEEN